MSTIEKNQARIDREHNEACGAIIRSWSRLEGALVFYFQAACQLDDQFRARMIFYSMPNFQARRRMLDRFAENFICDEAVLDKYRKMMKRVVKFAQKRNMIAHTSNGVAQDGKILFLHTEHEGEEAFLFLKIEEYQRENVKNWAADIDQLWQDMMHFQAEFSSAVHTSSKMHRELQNDRNQKTDQE